MKKGRLHYLLRRICQFVLEHVLIDTLFFHYGKYRHRRYLATSKRSQVHTYTSFHRSPGQLEVLSREVIKYITANQSSSLKIAVFAGSNGSEAFTIASHIRRHLPYIEFRIICSDLHQENIDHAQAGVYSPEEVESISEIPQSFIDFTFDFNGKNYLIKDEIKDKVDFVVADLLDPVLANKFEQYDIVLLQNVLFHLEPENAEFAFKNVMKLLKLKSVLFIDGMELDMKERLTQEFNLEPVNFNIAEIYRYSRRHVPRKWWNYYYGNEPYSIFNRKNLRRFCTIFLRDSKPT